MLETYYGNHLRQFSLTQLLIFVPLPQLNLMSWSSPIYFVHCLGVVRRVKYALHCISSNSVTTAIQQIAEYGNND